MTGIWDCASYELLLQTESRRRILLDASLCAGDHLSERVTGSDIFRSHFSNFSSARGPIFKFLSIHSGSQFFHLSTFGLSKWGIVSALGCQKWDFVSALGSMFNCCTALVKTLISEPPSPPPSVTLTKKSPRVSMLCTHMH